MISAHSSPPHTPSPTAAGYDGYRPAVVALPWAVAALLYWALSLSGPWREMPRAAVYAGAWGVVWWLVSLAIARLRYWLRVVDAGVVRTVLVHLVVLVAAAALDAAVRRGITILGGGTLPISFWMTVLFFADITVAAYCGALVLAAIGEAHRQLVDQERADLAARADRARARLDRLRSQFHPHFLFNALGLVTELLHDAPRDASRTLGELASLVRGNTEETRQFVPLREELDSIGRYLALQRVRFADWLTISWTVDPEALDVPIVPFVLQPLVENALHHGLARRSTRGELSLHARLVKGRLEVRITDNGAGLSDDRPSGGWGIGLASVRERLEIGYGASEHDFVLSSSPDGGTVALLRVPTMVALRDASPGSGARPAPPARRSWSRGRIVAAAMVAWAFWGLAWTQNSLAYLSLRGRLQASAIPHLVLDHLAATMTWVVLTPAVVVLARWLVARHPPWWLAGIAHAAGAVAFAAAHTTVWMLAMQRPLADWGASYNLGLVLNVVLYGLMVGLVHRHQLTQWLHMRQVAAAEESARQAERPLEGATAALRPEELAVELDRLAITAAHDPAGAEQALVALGDRLRAALDGMRAAPSASRVA